MKQYERLYYHAVVFANDMKHIHTHSVGNKFDRLHAIAAEYYEKASNESDDYVELALEFGEKVENPSNAAAILDYEVANEAEYDWDKGIADIRNRLAAYLAALEDLRYSGKIPTDVESKLDDIIRYWRKENNYKNVARMKE